MSILGGALPRQCEVNGDSVLLCRAHLILQRFAATRYYLLFRFESALVITYSARRPLPLGMGRKRRSFLLGGVLNRLDGDEPAAEGDGRQSTTVAWFGALRHALICFVRMQAEALHLAVITANGAVSIGGMLDEGSPLHPERTRAAVRLAYTTSGGFQPMQLAPMELVRHAIPYPSAGGRWRSTGGGR